MIDSFYKNLKLENVIIIIFPFATALGFNRYIKSERIKHFSKFIPYMIILSVFPILLITNSFSQYQYINYNPNTIISGRDIKIIIIRQVKTVVSLQGHLIIVRKIMHS